MQASTHSDPFRFFMALGFLLAWAFLSNGDLLAQNDPAPQPVMELDKTSTVDRGIGPPVELDRRHLQSQRIPDPQARFGGKSTQDTCIRLVVAQHAPCVSAGLHHSDWDIPLEVHSFSMFLDQGDELIQMHSHSARLTADQKNLLDSAEVGDLLTIEDIVVVLPDGSLRALASLKFRLTT